MESRAMINVTESAARQVRAYLERERTPERPLAGLRLGVRGGGCAGFEYVKELAEGAREGDVELEFHGLRVFIDPRSLEVLDGTELDFVSGLENHGFHFRNPRETTRCGCGVSFSVG
ncbi:MAG: iron-sulfur cluster assembly accessory protein [Candidatus Eiseniibacteriota bacterium]